jgi:ATP-dependent HslUV protease ATP-binding subunit HslU
MLEDLTPRQVVAELDKYIIGQTAAKRAVAIALRNRYRRRLLRPELRDEVVPKNILMIGPTGVGKTEIARRLALLARAPFVKVEATKFTEVGYVGRDVDSMVRDLVQVAIRMVEAEKREEVKDKAAERAVNRIVDVLQPQPRPTKIEQAASGARDQITDAISRIFSGSGFAGAPPGVGPAPSAASSSSAHASESQAESSAGAPASGQPVEDAAQKRAEQIERIRARMREQVSSGARDAESIDIDVEDSAPAPILQVFGGQGDSGGPGDNDMQNILGSLMPKKRKRRNVTIAEAKQIFEQEEAQSLIDHDQVTREAITRAEQTGIIFVDEMDKIAGRGQDGGRGPDVSREGVQRDILPIIEGSTVQTKVGPVRTDFMLFIAAGAFHLSKPSDLIPELQGRLPIRVELESLTEADLARILTEPQNALIKQYTELLATEGVMLEFTDDSIAELASTAAQVNSQMENIGARRLYTIMERLLDELSFEAPYGELKHITIDRAFVKERLESIVKDEDLSRYIL